jgi:hypothetical protein
MTSIINRTFKFAVLVIFVGFWWWCISIKRIVFLDFIDRLVSQEQKQNKIKDKT